MPCCSSQGCGSSGEKPSVELSELRLLVTLLKVASNEGIPCVTEVSSGVHKSLLLNLLAGYPSSRVRLRAGGRATRGDPQTNVRQHTLVERPAHRRQGFHRPGYRCRNGVFAASCDSPEQQEHRGVYLLSGHRDFGFAAARHS